MGNYFTPSLVKICIFVVTSHVSEPDDLLWAEVRT